MERWVLTYSSNIPLGLRTTSPAASTKLSALAPTPWRACCCTVFIVSKGAKIVFEHAAAKPDAKLFLKPSEAADGKAFLFAWPPPRYVFCNSNNCWFHRTAGHGGGSATEHDFALHSDSCIEWTSKIKHTILWNSIDTSFSYGLWVCGTTFPLVMEDLTLFILRVRTVQFGWSLLRT